MASACERAAIQARADPSSIGGRLTCSEKREPSRLMRCIGPPSGGVSGPPNRTSDGLALACHGMAGSATADMDAPGLYARSGWVQAAPWG